MNALSHQDLRSFLLTIKSFSINKLIFTETNKNLYEYFPVRAFYFREIKNI